MPTSVPIVGAVRGRGAKSNHAGRFEWAGKADFDDGWTEQDPAPPRLDDTLTALKSKTIISHNDSPDIFFDQSINPYIGCSHGCIYCYARPSHAYMGLSPGIDFESKLFFKPDAERLLERGAVEEGLCLPADPHRRQHRRLPAGGTTPAHHLRRAPGAGPVQPPLLDHHQVPPDHPRRRPARLAGGAQPGAGGGLGHHPGPALARAMEPRAATPARRLAAIETLARAGVPVGVNFAPVIPGLNDHELEAVLDAAAGAGARSAGYTLLRLPLEIKDLFREWLEVERPDRARRVMSLVRQTRGGKDYDADWTKRMRGEGPIADLIRARFKRASAQFGLNNTRIPMATDLFRPPPQAGDQGDLFASVKWGRISPPTG